LTVDYRRERLLGFLDPGLEPLGINWQANQSLIAVGSGGLTGVGLANSAQKLHFLPHPHSDFVYAVVAEELGFLGAVALLVVFALLVWRGAVAGARAREPFARYLAWGLTGMLAMQAALHVGVVLKLLPTKGIPLPFVSYGGSSLVVSMAAAGLILNVSQQG
jgi:cell division protein FtsW